MIEKISIEVIDNGVLFRVTEYKDGKSANSVFTTKCFCLALQEELVQKTLQDLLDGLINHFSD